MNLLICYYPYSMIKRTLSHRIHSKIGRGKTIMIIGSRQIGKRTLILKYLEDVDCKLLFYNKGNIKKQATPKYVLKLWQ